MTVDRQFLDLFWTISGEDKSKRLAAIEKLLSSLVDKTGRARPEYVDYTKERLVKGLKSFAADARLGFSETLILMLCKHRSLVTNTQLLELFNKHIYSTTTSTAKEEKSVKYAYILCPKVLCETDRITQFKLNDLKPIIDRLLKLSSSSSLMAEILSVSQLLVSKLPPKLVYKLFAEFTQQVWQSFSATDSELLGDQLLFLLRVRRRLKGIDVDKLPASIDLSAKMFRRKLINGFQHSTGDTVLALLDEAIDQNALGTFWPKLSEILCDKQASVKQRKTLLLMASHVICQRGNEWTRCILSKPVVHVLLRQISKPTLSCFEDARSLLRKCLETVCAPYTRKRTAPRKQIEVMDIDDAHAPATPSMLFSCFSEAYPICDLISARNAPKPLQFLMSTVPDNIEQEALLLYANQLMQLFLQPTAPTVVDDAYIDGVDQNALRSFAVFQLQRVLWCLLRSGTSSVSLERAKPFLTFLVTVALSGHNIALPDEYRSEGTPIGRSYAESCWISLFRLLTQFASHAGGTLQKLDTKDPSSPRLLSELLLHLVNTIVERLASLHNEPDTTVLHLADHLQQSTSLLKKARSDDELGAAMVMMHTITCLYCLFKPSDDLNTLLDDLAECFKRRRSCRKGQSSDDSGPAWPSVLTDVVLGLIANPSNMLRTFARILFDQLIVSGACSQECVQLLCDVSKTRVDRPGVNKIQDGEEDEEENVVSFPDETLKVVEENEDEELEIQDESDESSKELEEVDEMEDDKSELSGSESDSDDDEPEEQIDLDDPRVKDIRESVKTALGPAALDEDEIDSSSYREFTDAEMFARDEALAAAFRANRLNTPKRTIAERARSLGQLKMRCLDQFTCIIQNSSQPDVFWPTITHLLSLAKEACVAELKAHPSERQKQDSKNSRQRLSEVARSGDLPELQRVLDLLKRVTSRESGVQTKLTNATLALPNPEGTLTNVMGTVVQAVKVGSPPPQYLSAMASIVQFLFRLASAHCEPSVILPTLSEPLLKEFRIYLTSTRKSSIAASFFLTLLHQCHMFATQATPLMLDAFTQFLDTISSSDGTPDGAAVFAHTNCCNALGMLFQALAEKRYEDSCFPKAPKRVLTRAFRTLSTLNLESTEEVERFVWFSKLSVATAVFNLLTWATKVARKQGFEPVLESKLIQHLRNLPCKSVIRKPVRKFVNFFSQSANIDGLSKKEKQAMKAEQKQARRAKRKEKALLRQQKLAALNKNKGAEGGDVRPTQNGEKKLNYNKASRKKDMQNSSLKRTHKANKNKNSKRQKLSDA